MGPGRQEDLNGRLGRSIAPSHSVNPHLTQCTVARPFDRTTPSLAGLLPTFDLGDGERTGCVPWADGDLALLKRWRRPTPLLSYCGCRSTGAVASGDVGTYGKWVRRFG